MNPLTRAVTLGALLIAAVAWLRHDAFVRGGLAQAEAQLAVSDRALTHVIRKTDTAYVKQRVPFERAAAHYDSVRVHDTVPVLVPVPGKPDTAIIYVPRAAADAAVSSCSAVLLTCEKRVAQRDSLLGIKDQRIHVLETAGRNGRWTDRFVSAGTGALLTLLVQAARR